MHVLLLPSWYSTADKPWRGAYFADQARALNRHGLRAGIAFVERRSLSRLTPASIIASHFQVTSSDEDRVPTLRMKGWSTFAQTNAGAMLWVELTRRLVRAYVAEHGVPDVIHGHAAMWGGHAAMLCARDLGRPFVVTEHASSILNLDIARANRPRVAAIYRNAARVVAVSDALKASVDCVAGREVAEVVPNAIDTRSFRVPPSPRSTRPFVFLAVGDLVPAKRADMLIRAFARVHANAPETQLVIAGGGGGKQRLQDLADSLGVRDFVELTGALTRAEVRQRMWQSNALVVSSDFETFGVVLVEALSTGIPAIATRCGGPEEIITPDLGTLVDCGDESALASAMTSIIGRSFDSSHLHEAVARSYGYEEVAQKLCTIYESAASRRRAVA
ncbi:MAG TPA: glycosyltransferase [Thermoanaerobaculia bacterium]